MSVEDSETLYYEKSFSDVVDPCEEGETGPGHVIVAVHAYDINGKLANSIPDFSEGGNVTFTFTKSNR